MDSQLLGGQTVEAVRLLEGMELLGLNLAACLAGGEGLLLHVILQFNALGVRPGDVAAEAFPVAPELALDSVGEGGLLDQGFHRGVNSALRLGSFSFFPSLGAIIIIQSKHVVIRPSIHLDWEDRCLEGEGLEAHLVDPGLEVKAFHWWHGIVPLTWLNLVVVLAWGVKAQEHGLGTQDGGVIPRGLDVDLSNVVELVHESGFTTIALLFLDVPVAEFISNHVLLADAEWSDVVGELWLVVLVLGEVEELGWGVRALGTDLVDILDVLG